MNCDFSALTNIDTTDPDQVAMLMQQCTAVVFDPMLWLWAVIFTMVGTLVGALIGKYKKAIVRDAILGATLGPIGWVISWYLPTRTQQCSKCGMQYMGADRYCRRCGQLLQASQLISKPD